MEAPADLDSPVNASILYADDGGFRDDSGYRQWKVHGKARTSFLGGRLTAALSATDLDQETAGFIVGEDAYKDPEVNRSNPNPEAFREASSQRLYAIWTRELETLDIDVRPFLRHSDMKFLQHFLPGQPLEENGHVSVGALISATLDAPAHTTVVGADVEYSEVTLEQTQFGPTEGSDFLRETRPEGKHYDYEVSSFGVAPYLQSDFRLGDALTFGLGLRAEYLRYDYNNRMLTGNTRDDGTECGFGGCLYSRPADRTDSFVNLAPQALGQLPIRRGRIGLRGRSKGFQSPAND